MAGQTPPKPFFLYRGSAYPVRWYGTTRQGPGMRVGIAVGGGRALTFLDAADGRFVDSGTASGGPGAPVAGSPGGTNPAPPFTPPSANADFMAAIQAAGERAQVAEADAATLRAQVQALSAQLEQAQTEATQARDEAAQARVDLSAERVLTARLGDVKKLAAALANAEALPPGTVTKLANRIYTLLTDGS